jgi:hypothetical protein
MKLCMGVPPQVHKISSGWGELYAAVENTDDIFDIYIRQSGLLAWKQTTAEPGDDELELPDDLQQSMAHPELRRRMSAWNIDLSKDLRPDADGTGP